MADVLAFAEQRDGAIGGAAKEAVTVAARLAEGLGGEAHAVLLGAPGVAEAASSLGAYGAARIHVGEHEALGEYNPEGYAPVLAERIRAGGYGAVVLPASTLGKDLAPRVAALLDVPLATDVTGLGVEDGAIRITRPVYSGKAFANLTVEASPVVASIRPNAFLAEERQAAAEVAPFDPGVDPGSWRVRTVRREAASGGALDVTEASVIVSGGRGMKDPSNWGLLEELRDAIGTDVALGASRAVVDAGWRPHGEQVGQTGKTVAPNLYFAVGISGAIQHLAGMRTSRTIVAINRDADAPIFQIADYGVVGDLFEIVPKLTEEISALRSGG